jgi:tRNA pseudouridine55 synthase
MDGVLVIDKPAGPTSHDIVARARRALREKRIGHTGTLDPMATGVLALVIGKATRLASFLSADEKEYEATVRFGSATDTYDALGSPVATDSRPSGPVDPAQVEAALIRFKGTFEQLPPPYSAKKIAGVAAYKLAREQKEVRLAPVSVTVHALELLEIVGNDVRLRMTTSAGFYVRSLAHDLGARLGCGGHLTGLRRIRSGRFDLAESIRLENLQRDPEAAADHIIGLSDLLPELPAVRVTEIGAERVSHGNWLRPQDFVETGPVPLFPQEGPFPGTGPVRVRVVDAGGRLLAIAAPGTDGLLRPSVVLV